MLILDRLGYDAGVVSELFTSPRFMQTFNITEDNWEAIKGNMVAILQAGCAFGALVSNIPADLLGRKKTIMISAWIFMIGSIIQAACNTYSPLLVGRFITGFGIGQGAMVAPLYIAEISPADSRGRMVSIFQILLVHGLCLSFWISYGFIRAFSTSDWQWRWPLIIQLMPAFIVITCGLNVMPESIRWLIKNSRYKRSLQILSKLRDLPLNHPDIIEEFDQIQYSVQLERMQTFTKAQQILFDPKVRRQLIIGCLLQFFQQVASTNAVNYYAPSLFKTIGISGGPLEAMATGLYGNIKLLFVYAAYFIVDSRMGRRKALLISSVITAVAFNTLGILLSQSEDITDDAIGIRQIMAILMLYLFAIGFEIGWGPVVWIICSEIYPDNIRAVCVSLTTTINFVTLAIMSKMTPLMLEQIGWKTEIVFGGIAIGIGIFVFCFLPETRGLSLEHMTEAFQGNILVFRKSKSASSYNNVSLASAIEAQFPREKAPSVRG
ncbi:general substrate transporter [Umbelopsis sp. AD052]|nr:general substrate transporter [Umbelopsis sp. AD052]